MIRRFAWFLIIVAILAAGNALRQEFREFATVIEEIALLRGGEKNLDAHLRLIGAAAADRVKALETASLDRLRAQVESIEREMEQLHRQKTDSGVIGLLTGPIGKEFMERLKADVEVKILEQESDYLKRLILYAESMRDSQAAKMKLETLRLAHVDAYARLRQVERELAAVEQGDFWMSRLGFWSNEFIARQRLRNTFAAQEAANLDAYQSYERQRKVVESISLPRLPRFELRQDQVDQWLQPVKQLLQKREERYRSNWVTRASGPVIEVLPAAALILLSLILVPIAIKAVFYFLIAPLTARRPPIRLLPEASGILAGQFRADPRQTKISAVSLPITLGNGQELLIHPEYLQSSSVRGEKDTKWLLDWSYPLSSLASGMFALTRIHGAADETFVISTTRDPLSEVGILSLPEGSALVFQPCGLVGIVQHKDRPLRISRHWRLGSLHAWLTLQLRYLIFHGPVDLIVKGCRGVRVERVGAGRSINQAATLGFSANVDYATRRCETFGAYLMGKDELFNDYFTGDNGYYVYEEMPHGGRKPGITGRGIEGIADSMLKVFGI